MPTTPKPCDREEAAIQGRMGNKSHTVAQRIQALALLEEGVTVKRIEEVTELSRATIFRLRQNARARGYDPEVSRVLKAEYVEDAARSGRPREISKEQGEELLQYVGESNE